MKGTYAPMGLYTIDMDIEKLPVSKDPAVYEDLVERNYVLKEKKQKITDKCGQNNFFGEEIFKHNKDLKIILR